MGAEHDAVIQKIAAGRYHVLRGDRLLIVRRIEPTERNGKGWALFERKPDADIYLSRYPTADRAIRQAVARIQHDKERGA